MLVFFFLNFFLKYCLVVVALFAGVCAVVFFGGFFLFAVFFFKRNNPQWIGSSRRLMFNCVSFVMPWVEKRELDISMTMRLP